MQGHLIERVKTGINREEFYVGSLILEFIEYVLVFTIIAECNTLFHNSENYIPTSAEVVLTLISIILTALLVLVYGSKHKQELIGDLIKNRLIWGTVLFFIILFFFVNVIRIGGTHAVRKYIFSFVLFLPLSYALLMLYRFEGKPNELFFKHSNIICFITILNLIVYFCVHLSPDVVRVQYTQTRWGGLGELKTWLNYLNVCIFSGGKRVILGCSVFCNYGFTTEPLMFCIQLVIALYTELFLREKEQRKVWKPIVLLVAIFTTQSTIGLLIAVGTIGLKLVSLIKNKRMIILCIPIAIVVVGVAFVLIQQKRETEIGSFNAHFEHYRASIEAFLDHPLIGVGYVNEPAVVKYVNESISNTDQGLSNSMAVVFAEGGILLAGICIASFAALFGQIKKHDSMKNVALWALGPFGLYCLTLLHFHLLLLLIIDFGYSMLEVREKGKRRSLALRDDLENISCSCLEEGSNRNKAVVTITLITMIVLTSIILLISSTTWNQVFAFMKSNQLLFGQSTWKVYCFSLFIMLLVLVIKHWFRTFELWKRPVLTKETIFFIMYTMLFAFTYKYLYSWVSTALGDIQFFGDAIETFVIATLYFAVVIIGWIIVYFWHSDKRLATTGLISLVLCISVFSGLMIRRVAGIEIEADSINQALNEALSRSGKIYANENSVALKSKVPCLKFSGARFGAFSVFKEASVITIHDNILSELLESGFEVTELSNQFIIYTNDRQLIESLSIQGYEFYAYYPYDTMNKDQSQHPVFLGNKGIHSNDERSVELFKELLLTRNAVGNAP